MAGSPNDAISLSTEPFMRLTYFGYYVRCRRTGDKHLVDLRQFFYDFSAANDVAFKSQFTYGGEALLLQRISQTDTYLFVQARDMEIVKSIQKQHLSAHDISILLGSNNSIGFASYVTIEQNWMAFSCKVLSPRQTAFGNFVNELFQALNIPFDFVFRALQTVLPARQVPELERVGKIRVEVNASSPILQQVGDLLTGGSGEELVDAAEVHISIIPRRGKRFSLGATLNSMVNSLPRDGLESIEARAKLEAAERMSDMYIYGEGSLRDYLKVGNETEIPRAVVEVARANRQLQEKINEYREDDEFKTDASPRDLGIDWARAHVDRGDRD